VTRFGSRRALAVALPAFAAMRVPIGYANTLPTLMVALVASAAVNSVVDVAINDQGVALQRRYGRSVLSGLHAMHSLGGVAGAGLAAAAAATGVGVRAHFAVVAIGGAALALLASSVVLPHPQLPRRLPTHRAAVWPARLVVLGGLAFVFTLAEGSAQDWGAVLLRDAAPATAAAALAAFQGCVALGRLAGDRAVDRHGAVRVFRLGALLAGGGLAGGLLLGTAGAALVGLALFGAGLANLLPLAIAATGSAGSVPVPVAVARVSTLGYLGSFAGPALIGTLAHPVGLAGAMLLPGCAVAATGLAARAVRSNDLARAHRRRDHDRRPRISRGARRTRRA
jgi:hypothetical protein